MNRQFGVCALLAFLCLSSQCFAQDAPVTKALSPELHISVYDNADVPIDLMAAAEAAVCRIFHLAGVETLWRNCSEKGVKTQPAGCHVVGSNYIVLKVLPHAMSVQVRERADVLGIAMLDEKGVGFYGYAFYDQIQRMADERRLAHTLLGHVLAHEIGHLLLRSNSHPISGIMSGRWMGEESRKISEGALLFTPLESKVMRDRLLSVALKPGGTHGPLLSKLLFSRNRKRKVDFYIVPNEVTETKIDSPNSSVVGLPSICPASFRDRCPRSALIST